MKKELIFVVVIVIFTSLVIASSTGLKYSENKIPKLNFVKPKGTSSFQLFNSNSPEKNEKRYYPTMDDVVGITNANSSWLLQADTKNLTGLHQTVCIIDTGINYSHESLGDCFGNNDPNSSCKVIGGWNTVSENNDITDNNGHGTHVSGIAAGNGTIRGIAPDAKIVFIKAYNDTGGYFSSGNIKEAINWCVDNATKFNISVISMSLGADCTANPEYCHTSYCNSESEVSSINAAVAKNISVVISSGNDHYYNAIASPGCIENATAITSTNKEDTNISLFANTWNDSSLLMLASPGENVHSSWKDGGYANESGTSMSAPAVAGTILILKQMYSLQNKSSTPNQIEQLLNSTGKQIYDSNATRFFPRIDIHAALLSLDLAAPKVTLISPQNNMINLTQNQTLSFNTTDWQLKNASVYLWNSTGIYNVSSINLTGTENSSSFEVLNLPYDNYKWNVLVYDENNNSNFATNNFSFVTGGISLEVNNPSNESYVSYNETNFSCSIQTDPTYELTNITFYLWNSTNLVTENISNLTGTENSSSWIYELPTNGTYYWGCIAFNNNSENDSSENYTITYDTTFPNIRTSSESTTTTLVRITWTTNEETNASIVSDSNVTNSSFSTNHSETIHGLSASTSYNYNLTYCDRAGNCNSTNGTFTTSDAPVVSGHSGGGGGGGITSKTYKLELTEQSQSKTLAKGDKIIFEKGEEKHSVTLKNIWEDKANITIESDPVNFLLEIGKSKKLNLSSNKYFDLMVKLEGITYNKANITLTIINESIFKPKKILNNKTEKKYIPHTAQNNEPVLDTNWGSYFGGLLILAGILYFIFKKTNWKNLKRKKTDKKNGSKSLGDGPKVKRSKNEKAKAKTQRKG